jgi:hypothetical protein
MRSFKEFLLEAGGGVNVPHAPVPAPTHQAFKFPNFNINPPPIGGYDSFSGVMTHQYGAEKPDFTVMNSLTNLIQTISADPDAYAIQQGTLNTQVQVGPDEILNIPYAKVVSPTTIMGGHGKLTGPQFQYAQSLGFVRESPSLGSDYFDIIGIGNLRAKLWSIYNSRRWGAAIAQKADQTMDAMVTPSRSAQPLFRNNWG